MSELELKLARALMGMVGQHCAATPDLDDTVTADFNCMSCDEGAIKLLFDIGLATPQGERQTGVSENTFLGGAHKLEFGKLGEMEAGWKLLYKAESVIEECVFAEIIHGRVGTARIQLVKCNHGSNSSLYADSCNAKDCPIKECVK